MVRDCSGTERNLKYAQMKNGCVINTQLQKPFPEKLIMQLINEKKVYENEFTKLIRFPISDTARRT